MIRLIVPILILLLLLSGAVWALRGFKLPEFALAPFEQEATPSSPSKTKPSDKQAASGEKSTSDNANTSFDIARIDPTGVSVFAGRADPGSRVTVMGDGQAVGTAQADENGEWTLATEHHFATSDPKLALLTKSAAQAQAEDKAKAAKLAEQREVIRASEGQPTGTGAAEVTTQLLKNLEGMVEDARSEMQTKEVAAADPSDLPPEAVEGDVSAPGAAAMKAALPLRIEPSPRKSVPLPIMFVFNEANMTDEGRKAASLLLEYLQIKHFNGITLTGHADERGTDALNMALSRERLEAVAHYLKAGGYDGRLTLLPKGETEPFMGVDRSQYSKEDLYQLDRRVELIITP